MPPAYEVLLLNTAVPQIQAAQSGDTYVVPRDIAFSAVANLANGTYLLPALAFSSDPDTGIFRQGANALGFTAGGGSDQMVLTTTGLGIGTSSPLATFDVKGATDTHVGIAASGIDEAIILAFDDGGIRTPNLSYAAASHKFLINTTEQMRLDSSGNLGLGVTPSAWTANADALQIKAAALWNDEFAGKTSLGYNNYQDTDTTYRYISTLGAGRYDITQNIHRWFNAPSGTAGDPITFTQAMTLDASGNLVVGTTGTAQGRVHAHATTNAQFVATDATLGTTYGGVFRGYGVGGQGGNAELGVLDNGSYTKAIKILDNATGIQFFTGVTNAGSSERARITSSGNLDLQNNIGLGGASATTSGTGITFPATQSASSDANTLDDYEEGLHTAVITTGTSGTVTLSGTEDVISYTKIGRQVTVIGGLAVASVASPVGFFYVSLPFAIGDLSEFGGRASGSVTVNDNNGSNVADFVVLALEGESGFRVYLGDAASVQADSANALQGGSQIYVSFTYFV